MQTLSIITKTTIKFILIALLSFGSSDFLAQNSITINSNSGKNKISIRNSRSDFKV